MMEKISGEALAELKQKLAALPADDENIRQVAEHYLRVENKAARNAMFGFLFPGGRKGASLEQRISAVQTVWGDDFPDAAAARLAPLYLRSVQPPSSDPDHPVRRYIKKTPSFAFSLAEKFLAEHLSGPVENMLLMDCVTEGRTFAVCFETLAEFDPGWKEFPDLFKEHSSSVFDSFATKTKECRALAQKCIGAIISSMADEEQKNDFVRFLCGRTRYGIRLDHLLFSGGWEHIHPRLGHLSKEEKKNLVSDASYWLGSALYTPSGENVVKHLVEETSKGKKTLSLILNRFCELFGNVTPDREKTAMMMSNIIKSVPKKKSVFLPFKSKMTLLRCIKDFLESSSTREDVVLADAFIGNICGEVMDWSLDPAIRTAAEEILVLLDSLNNEMAMAGLGDDEPGNSDFPCVL